jgi:HK97 family phage portal protein
MGIVDSLREENRNGTDQGRGIISSILGTEKRGKKGATIGEFDGFLDWLVNGGGTAGVNVTEATALKHMAVFACVKILAESIASLPLHTYERLKPRGKRPAHEYWLYPILHDSPNPEMTAQEYREAAVGHIAGWGNHFSEIERSVSTGEIVALWPLNPAKMEQVTRDPATDQIIYKYRLPNNTLHTFPRRRIWHLKAFSHDGFLGISPIRQGAETIGVSMAAEQYAARFFSQADAPPHVLTHPSTISDPAQERLKKDWRATYSGLSNAHRIAILEEGMDLKTIGIKPEDAQLLASRRFQLADVARIYRIPLHMLNELERATFSNIEHQSLEFVIFTLLPWLTRIEQSISLNLLPPRDRAKYYSKHLVSGLARGDLKTRYEAYAIGRQWGWLTINMILELEEMNPIGPEGDVHMVPMNMYPAELMSESQPLEHTARYLKSIGIEPPGEHGQAGANSKQIPDLRHSQRSIQGRNRIIGSYRRLFELAAGRLVRRQVIEIKRAVKKYLEKRALEDFQGWLNAFYADLTPLIEQQMAPVFRSLAETLIPEVGNEIGLEIEFDETHEKFLASYMESFEGRHVSSSRGQIVGIIEKTDPEDLGAAITTRLDEWDEKRAGKMARRETRQAGNAIVKVVYAAAGVEFLRWVAQGSDTCPYCQELDGQVVGINSVFIEGNSDFQPEGAEAPMHVRGSKSHGPLHDGCECTITAA